MALFQLGVFGGDCDDEDHSSHSSENQDICKILWEKMADNSPVFMTSWTMQLIAWNCAYNYHNIILIQQIFIEHLPYAGHSARSGIYSEQEHTNLSNQINNLKLW
jgi:hypothetical protein